LQPAFSQERRPNGDFQLLEIVKRQVSRTDRHVSLEAAADLAEETRKVCLEHDTRRLLLGLVILHSRNGLLSKR
jgi:hypothetical protein